MKQINKVLIANRGEIALRIYRTLGKMGITTVAVYSPEDANALHVQKADERYPLSGSSIADTYLNIDQIIAIALDNGVDAIHPGYGFLSENHEFARAVREAGMVFIGPAAEAIRKMGNKNEARNLAASLGIPVIQGVTGNPEELLERSANLEFPVIVKAAAGGGGKGMHIAATPHALRETLERAGREAKSYFGSDELYIERYLDKPRHIEVQLLADQHGNVVSLFGRECSLQRRHQKIIEEAPATGLPRRLDETLSESARRLAREINYHNAGTVEFLVDDKGFYFLEMNTRIQVEHPATEMITGIDIVREQLRIASGQPLPFGQGEIRKNGHAIEARIYAEDPKNGLLPSPGNVILHNYPGGNGMRIDTGIAEQGPVSASYDPLISKVIAHAGDRETARKKLCQYLQNYVLMGVRTNIAFLIHILESQDFIRASTHTGTTERILRDFNAGETAIDKDLLAMAHVFNNPSIRDQNSSPWLDMGPWRLLPNTNILIDDTPYARKYQYHNARHTVIRQGDKDISYRLVASDSHSMHIDVDGHVYVLYYQTIDGETIFQHKGLTARVRPVFHFGKETLREISKNPVLEGERIIRAPMQGTVVKITVEPGQKVNKGDTLLILESMKMENKISATARAFVKKIHVGRGEAVADNSPLIHLAAEPE